MDILDLPDDLKQTLRDGVVEFVARQVEKVTGGDKTASVIRQLSSQAVFYNAFNQAVPNALKRLQAEYTTQDEDLVEAILTDGDFWHSRDVRQALMCMLNRPGSWLVNERETVVKHFADVLPRRVNRERVDKAVTFFLGCVLEELWTLPGVREIREIYSLQFQKIGAEAARQQVALLEAQLQAIAQQNTLSAEVLQAFLQLAATLEQRLLTTPPLHPSSPSPRPYHNLPQPDYTTFVGRQKELDWLRQRQSPTERAWQMVIAGMGGVGKSALALAIAHYYREEYHNLPSEDRFEAIIWTSAKEEVLTVMGRKEFALPGLISRTLEDIYTTIAQTLKREDITRAISLEEQNRLVQKALSSQRTLLIVDNIESINDERVRTFLRNLPVPTKCIITSREWVDVADVLRLTGLPPEEAESLITEEATAREVKLNAAERQQVFKRTSGLPLPIKLSVARMASGETFDQVMRWLGNATGDLPEYCVKGQIDIARRRDPHAWKLLFASSLFDREAGASREALGFVADLSLADRDDGLTLLQRLSLLNQTENERFRMLPMVQGYAGAELGKADFGGALIEGWLSWCLAFTQEYGIDLEWYTERAQLVASEYPNLLSAIRWCRRHERWETLLQLAEGINFYPYLVGLFGELWEILEAAVAASQALQDERSEERFIYRFGLLFRVQGQDEKALACLDKAEKIAFRYKDDAELGWICYLRSHILLRQSHLPEAEQQARAMFEIGKRLNNKELEVYAAHRLAEFASKKQQFHEALAWLDQSEQRIKESGWSRVLAWNMHFRGTTLLQQKDISTAEPFLLQSLNMAISWKEHRLIAHNKRCLTRVYSNTGRLQLALEIAREARDLFERLGMAEEVGEMEKLLPVLSGKESTNL